MNRSFFPAVLVIASIAAALIAAPASAGEKSADDADLVLEQIRTDKKLLVARNLQLTEAEAGKFWPVYASFQKDLAAINERTLQLVNFYAENYDDLSNRNAEKMVNEFIALQAARPQLYREYLPKFAAFLPMKKVALYYQLENKMNAAINYSLAEQIPFVK